MLNERSVRARKTNPVDLPLSLRFSSLRLPRAISVQLLKFFVNERFQSMMIVRTLPANPTSETMMM